MQRVVDEGGCCLHDVMLLQLRLGRHHTGEVALDEESDFFQQFHVVPFMDEIWGLRAPDGCTTS